MAKPKVAFPILGNAIYTKCYCEENVWKMCEQIKECHEDELCHCHVVFISNTTKAVPLWMQKAAKSIDHPVVWDYHVILIHEMPGGEHAMVYDLDTRLPMPCDILEYAKAAIRSDEILKPQFHRCFRVIGAEEFLATFASDRSHMLKEDGTWMAPPPEYDCIQSPVTKNNLDDFINMDSAVGYGQVLSYQQFIRRFIPEDHFTS